MLTPIFNAAFTLLLHGKLISKSFGRVCVIWRISHLFKCSSPFKLQYLDFFFFLIEVIFCQKMNPLCLAGLIYYVCSKQIIF